MTKTSNSHGSQSATLPPAFSLVPKYYRAVNSAFTTVMFDANHNSTRIGRRNAENMRAACDENSDFRLGRFVLQDSETTSLNEPLMHRRIGYDQKSMHVEAVQEGAAPTREGLVRDFMKIECRHCTVPYHLYHDGVGLNVLRDYFLQASWEISRQHPNHSRVIPLEKHSIAVHEEAS